ncbi:hypothetical protein Avbf_18457 [Armadillidium vulgare]|nr:hypothetical protein Avbf_18457 [Armadillidium vulgare]
MEKRIKSSRNYIIINLQYSGNRYPYYVDCNHMVLEKDISNIFSFRDITDLHLLSIIILRHLEILMNRIRKQNLKCSQPNGIFIYKLDCSKFINCANGIPHLQSCGPGTLFNPKILTCDHVWNVKCLGYDLPVTTPAKIGIWKPVNVTVKSRTEPPDESSGFFGKIANKFKKKIQSLTEKVKVAVKKTQKGVKDGFEENVEKSFGIIGSAINKVEKKVTGFKFYFKGGEQSSLCLKPDGQFPYPKVSIRICSPYLTGLFELVQFEI